MRLARPRPREDVHDWDNFGHGLMRLQMGNTCKRGCYEQKSRTRAMKGMPQHFVKHIRERKRMGSWPALISNRGKLFICYIRRREWRRFRRKRITNEREIKVGRRIAICLREIRYCCNLCICTNDGERMNVTPLHWRHVIVDLVNVHVTLSHWLT